jgi:hypothetical protein
MGGKPPVPGKEKAITDNEMESSPSHTGEPKLLCSKVQVKAANFFHGNHL